MHHCLCKCASLVGEQQRSRLHPLKYSHLQWTPTFSVLPRFDHCSLHCRLSHFGLQLSLQSSLYFLFSRSYVSCTRNSLYEEFQDCCTCDNIEFFTLLACALGLGFAVMIVCLAFSFRLLLHLRPFMQVPSTSMGLWSEASARRRFTTSVLIFA